MFRDCSEAGSEDSDLTSLSLEFDFQGSQGQGAALWLSVGPYSEFSWGHGNHLVKWAMNVCKDRGASEPLGCGVEQAALRSD